jgi:hypothetical protein
MIFVVNFAFPLLQQIVVVEAASSQGLVAVVD